MSEYEQKIAEIKSIMKTYPDFPKKGILFYDITVVLKRSDIYTFVVEQGVEWLATRQVNKVVPIEARGFLYGSTVAYRAELPLALVRKNKKLPGKTISKNFDTEYSHDTLEIQIDDISPGDRVVIVDDLIATGGTLQAVAELVTEAGATIDSFMAIIGLEFLNYAKKLDPYPIYTLIQY